MDAAYTGLDDNVARIDPADLEAANAIELTNEEEYDAALDREIAWDLEPDGTLGRVPRSSARDSVWKGRP